MPIAPDFFDAVHDRRGTGSVKYGAAPAGAAADVLPLWVADMDFPAPPAVEEALHRAARQGIYGYVQPGDDYWTLLRDWYRHRMGWDAPQEWFSCIPSVLSGVSAAIRALTEPGDGVALCQPVYYPFARIIRGSGRQVFPCDLLRRGDRYEFDFNRLEKVLSRNDCKVFLLCSPHNPVGRVWTRDELETLGRLCCRYNVYLLSDEIHADLIHAPHRHVPVASLAPEIAARTVTCMAPTKTFNLAGIPIAHTVIPDPALRRRVHHACSAAGYPSPGIMALAASSAAYAQGEEWLDALLDYLRGNMAMLCSAFPAGAPVVALPTEGTYLAWLDCRALGLDGAELDRFFLSKVGVWLDGGGMFGPGGAGYARLNFACPRSVLSEAIRRIRTAAG